MSVRPLSSLIKSHKYFEQDLESFGVVDEEKRILYESILYGTQSVRKFRPSHSIFRLISDP